MKSVKRWFKYALIFGAIWLIASIIFTPFEYYIKNYKQVFYLKYELSFLIFSLVLHIVALLAKVSLIASFALFMIDQLEKYDNEGNLIDIETNKS